MSSVALGSAVVAAPDRYAPEAQALADRQITLQANMLAFSKIHWLSGLVLA